MTSLNLGLVGNGRLSALIDEKAEVVWCCFPRPDGDPVFCSLLGGEESEERRGSFRIALKDTVRTEQAYLPDTPILVTSFYDASGSAVEVTDFCPRFEDDGALECPPLLLRQVRPISGKPYVTVTLKPAIGYGCAAPASTPRDGIIRYSGDAALQLNTDAPVREIADSSPILVDRPVTFMFASRTKIVGDISEFCAEMFRRTVSYWQKWSRRLTAPGQWRDATIRAAITLELHVYQDTGAIIAATTTSIPEAPHSGRNWDYRYCWPRDAYFTADALCRVGDTRAIERYLAFLLAVAEKTDDGRLVPIYNIDGGSIPIEHIADCLPGYRGMGPVRVGNKASEQNQNDLYGEAILTAEALFTQRSVNWAGDESLFARLEPFGHHAARLYDQPDAGLWELRGAGRVHTFSSVMCWVACDRLARYATKLNLIERAEYWGARASRIREEICRRSWNERMNAFTATMDGDSLDASLLLMPRLGFIEAADPRFAGTVAAIERDLKHGDFIYRYVERDDFGYPENSFLVCTFWYIEALARMGGNRRDEARQLFEKVLSARNRHGLLSEDLDPRTLELWGNFPQTYCMAGIIECALAMERR